MGKKMKKAAGQQSAVNLQNYQIQLDQYYANISNENRINALKDANAIREWERNEEIRQLQIKTQMDAYDRNDQAYNAAIDSIDMGLQDAIANERLALDQRITELAYQADDLDRDFLREQLTADFNLDALDIQRKNAELELGQQNRANSLAMSATSSEARTNILKQQLEGDAAKAEANAAGRRGRSATKATQSADAVAAINTGELAASLYFDTKKFGAEVQTTVENTRQKKKQYNLEEDKITAFLGISQEEFMSSREKLGQMLVDAEKQSVININSLQTKAYNSKAAAFASKMLPPRFADAAPAPFKSPSTDFVEPLAPVYIDPSTMKYGGGGQQQAPSGASQALGIGSAALGAAAMIPGPQQPFLAVGAALSGILGGFFS